MEFDKKKFLAGEYDTKPKAIDTETFDKKAFLAGEYDTKPQSDKKSGGLTALENFGDTLTLGYLPQLEALAEKPITKVMNAITGNNVQADGYIQARDQNRKRIEQMSAENPISAGAGKVAGIVASAPLMAGKALQGASALARVANAAKIGALYGAAQNPGDIEGEISPIQIGDRAKGAAIGGTIGAAAHGLVESAPYVKSAAKGSAEWFKDKAERAAFKALGPYQRDALKAASKEEIQKIGRTLIDEGILKGAPSYEEISKRASEKLGVKGQELEDLVNHLSEEGEKMVGTAAPGTVAKVGEKAAVGGIDRDLIADSIEKKLINPNEGVAGVAGKNAKFRQLLNEYRSKTGRFSNIKDNEELKKAIGKEINWKRLPDADIPIEEQFNRELYSATRQGSEDAAEAVAAHVGGDMPARFKNTKEAYGNLASAKKMAETRAAKDSANRFISPSDYLTGIGGMAYGASQGDDMESKLTGALVGAGLGVANRTLRTRGNPVVARGMDSVAKALMQIPKFAALAEKNPSLFNSYAQRIGLQSKQGAFESLPEQIEKLYVESGASEKELTSNSAKGENRWAQSGAEKLGIKDQAMTQELMQSKEGKRLLIEASDLAPGSKRLKQIQNQLSQGLEKSNGTEPSTVSTTAVLQRKRHPSSGR